MSRLITLNGLTRSYLNQSARPIHRYARCMKYGSDCLTELLFDTLQIINTVRIPVNEFHEAEIPEDCIDKLKVAVQVGQFLRPLVEKTTLNPLPNFSYTDPADVSQVVYPSAETDENLWTSLRWWGYNTNTNGENVGGYYGLGAGSEPDTFSWDEKRNVIQLNYSIVNTFIVLQYISDGTFVNAATQIPVYAKRTIETYTDWQYKENSKTYGLGDAVHAKSIFDRQHEILRARKDNLTPELVQRIINRHRKASIH